MALESVQLMASLKKRVQMFALSMINWIVLDFDFDFEIIF